MTKTTTILVVEDEKLVQELVSLYLENGGFKVVTAWDGQEALDWVRNNQPDLILLDIMLPKIDGLTVCKEIRKTSSIPIIMLTSKGEEVDRILGLELGADDYISKPFSPKEMVARVKAVLEKLGVEYENILNRPVSEISACPELAGLIREVLEAGEHSTLEINPGKGKTYILAHASPLKEESGQNYGAVVVLQDISELRQLEQLRRDFVANVSHELRTPLTSIQGFMEAMMDGLIVDEAARSRYIQLIHQETLRLNRLIHDLLDLSLIESGKIRWELEPIDVSDLVSVVLLKMEPQIDQQKLSVINEVPGGLPDVTGNRDRIEQVLTNLIANAIQFSPTGSTVSIKAHNDGNFVTVSVNDQGSGIPPDDLPHIWERFHRVEKSRNRTTGGTGLGLAIVKQIVESHGGYVDVKSELGRGSVFSFAIPVALSE